ncbi:hypothetical protein BD560DRAFT_405513 [Blakeslea trispora]|nr:hypothetical protein BD560DRAFT_405513 [Blakeslea trispora]
MILEELLLCMMMLASVALTGAIRQFLSSKSNVLLPKKPLWFLLMNSVHLSTAATVINGLILLVLPCTSVTTAKKKHRSGGFDGNTFESSSTLECYDEENHILHGTSQCPDQGVTGNRSICPLKLCPQHPANNNTGLFWNRDVNSAANIGSET